MPKINSLPTDKSLSKNDRLLGSDALGPTRNYKLEDVLAFIRDSNSAGVFGQLSYIYYNRFFGGNSQRPSGSMTIDTSSVNTAFDAVSTVKVSKYSYIGEDAIDNILATYLNKQVVIVDNNDPNNFATYVCGGVDQDITETDFYNLSLTYINGEGSLTSGNVYSTLISPSIGGDSVQSDWNATSGGALILNKPTIPTDNSELTNGAGYITDGNTNWNNTYGFITGLDWTELGGSQNSINLSGFNNDSGFITSYTETDTLDSVTGRGNTTTNDITASVLKSKDSLNRSVSITASNNTVINWSNGSLDTQRGGVTISRLNGAGGIGYFIQRLNVNVPNVITNLNAALGVRGSGTSSSTTALRVEDSSAIASLVVNDAGNVLIGTTTDAGYKLDVNGTARIGNSSYHLTLTNGGAAGGILRVGGANYGYAELKSNLLTLNGGHSIAGTGGTQQFIITSNIAPISADDDDYDGAMVFRANNPGAQSYNSWPSYPNAKAFNFIKKNFDGTYTSLMALNGSTNNVGIGVTSPSYKLDVNGTARAIKSKIDFTPTSDTIALDIRGTGTPNDYFTLSNATGGANDVFLPLFFYKAATYGYNGGTNRYPSGVYGGGFVAAVDDSSFPSSAGAGAAMHFNSRAYANNGPLSNRYLFSWGSWLTTHMAMTAGGNLLIGTTIDSGYKLDVNGGASVSGDVNADGDFYQNGTQGYTGTVTIQQPSPLPPINIDIQGGIITNVT